MKNKILIYIIDKEKEKKRKLIKKRKKVEHIFPKEQYPEKIRNSEIEHYNKKINNCDHYIHLLRKKLGVN